MAKEENHGSTDELEAAFFGGDDDPDAEAPDTGPPSEAAAAPVSPDASEASETSEAERAEAEKAEAASDGAPGSGQVTDAHSASTSACEMSSGAQTLR